MIPRLKWSLRCDPTGQYHDLVESIAIQIGDLQGRGREIAFLRFIGLREFGSSAVDADAWAAVARPR